MRRASQTHNINVRVLPAVSVSTDVIVIISATVVPHVASLVSLDGVSGKLSFLWLGVALPWILFRRSAVLVTLPVTE